MEAPKKTEEEIESWKEYRLSLLEHKSKSDDDFEKYITFISSGALGLTITFIDKITPLEEAIYFWLIAVGWILLAITLLVNLFSHYQSSRFTEKSIDEIDDNIDYFELRKNLERRNRIIDFYNKASIYSLFIGVIFILLYVIINSIK